MSFARDQAPRALLPVPAIEQWARVRRWEARVRKLDADPSVSADDLFDYTIALVQNAFAMRDWLKTSLPDRTSEIDLLFDSPRLGLVRDLANGSKHLTISKPSVDAQHAVLRVHALGDARGWQLVVLHRGESVDVPADGVGGTDADGTRLSGTKFVPLALRGVGEMGVFMAAVG